MARETVCMRCDRIVYISDAENVNNCPVCSTPLIDAASGQFDREPGVAEPGSD